LNQSLRLVRISNHILLACYDIKQHLTIIEIIVFIEL